MNAARSVAGIALCAAVALAPSQVHANPPQVVGPIHEEGTDLIADCGAFQIVDHFDLNYILRFMVSPRTGGVRIVEQVWGVDTFVNSVTGKSLSGTFHNNAFVDLEIAAPSAPCIEQPALLLQVPEQFLDEEGVTAGFVQEPPYERCRRIFSAQDREQQPDARFGQRGQPHDACLALSGKLLDGARQRCGPVPRRRFLTEAIQKLTKPF